MRPPFICFDILQQNGCQKIANGPPFTFFGTVKLFKNLHFGKFFHVPKGFPLQFFFHFLQPAGVSQSPKGLPFNFEPEIWRRIWPFSACFSVSALRVYSTLRATRYAGLVALFYGLRTEKTFAKNGILEKQFL